jgi:hypothetical protein
VSASHAESPVAAEVFAPPTVQPAPPTVIAIPGSITKQIGSGDHAQNSIVYQTILWSFIAGCALSIACFGYVAWKGADDPMKPIKEVWSIFGPIITLALGYMFGKGK